MSPTVRKNSNSGTKEDSNNNGINDKGYIKNVAFAWA